MFSAVYGPLLQYLQNFLFPGCYLVITLTPPVLSSLYVITALSLPQPSLFFEPAGSTGQR